MSEEEIKDKLYGFLVEELKIRLGDGYKIERDGDNIIVRDERNKIKRQYNQILKVTSKTDDVAELILGK